MDDNWGHPNFSGNLHIYDINGEKNQYDRIINNTLGEKRDTPFSDTPTYFQIYKPNFKCRKKCPFGAKDSVDG
jgi:hypothetical protein